MANKHLSEDEIQYTVDVKTAKAQQEIHKLETQSAALRNENKQRLQQMIKLEASGKKETDAYKKLAATYKDTGKQIRDLTSKIQDQTHKLDTNAMTMAQLRKQSKSLQKELDNVSKALNPKQYEALESRLKTVNARMAELKQNAKNYKELAASDTFNNFFMGELAMKSLETGVGLFKKMSSAMSEVISEGIDMAESADGITHAFRALDQPGLLDNLRKATKGTVNDVELMKAAVKARDFNIPLEDLGKYLSFAQLKAQQTGQSLDYMVDSIVTGLGRKSPMILDNLGLSAAEISEKTKETGDFMKGVASIVEKNLAEAGETYISAADRAAQKTTELQNRQRELGEALLPFKEEVSDAFGTMKIGIMQCIAWLFTHKKATLALVLAVGSLTVSMTVLNTAFRTWIAQTTLAKVVTAAWTSTLNTLKGVYLLVAAAINTVRGNTTLATAQMRLFNMACKSNVILLLVTALIAAGAALYSYMSKTGKAKKALVDFNLQHAKTAAEIKKQSKDIEKTVNESTAAEITKVKNLQATIKDTSKSYNKRKQAIQDLQSIVPGYHASITKEGKLFNENTKAIDTYINNLRRAARAEAAYEKMKVNERKILDLEDVVDDSERKKGNVNNAASKRGVNLAAGERVESRTQTVGSSITGYTQTNTYSVVVDKTGKVLREIDNATASLIQHDQQWGEMFDSRTKAARDSIKQYTSQNDRLQKIIDDNGGINQKFSPQNLNHDSGAAGGGKGGKSGSGNNAPDPDDTATKKFAADRQADIDAAKAAYQEDLNNLNMSLAQKKISQEQYNVYVSALNTQNATNLLAIEQSYQQQSEQIAFKDAEKKKKLQEDQTKRVDDALQKLTDAQIEAEKNYQAVMEKLTNEGKVAQTLTLEQERDAKLAVLDGYYKAAKLLAEQSGEDITNVETAYQTARQNILNDYADKELKRIKELEAQKAQARQEYGLDTFEDQYAAQAAKRKADYDKGLIDKQQYDQAMANLDRDAEDHKLQIRQQYGLASQQELYNAELEQLKQHLENKEISEEEYEEAVKNLKISKMKEAFDYYANLSNGAVQALQQAEEANVDAKYDAEIEAARNAGKDTSEIEKKKANEKLKIQKKYADVNFAIKASQIIADTATSIMKAYADLGPIAGSVAAALMGVTGVAQLAAANAERQRVKKMSLSGAGSSGSAGARVATGLESGGSIDIKREQDGKLFHAVNDPGKRGYVDKPTVIVGEGGYGHSREWVASNAAVENPTVAPFIDIIDRAQRAGTIRTLDMGKFLIQQAQGRASGGTVAPTVRDVRSIARDSYKDTLIERLTNILDRIADDGIPASVALDDIERKQQLRDKSRKFGSK